MADIIYPLRRARRVAGFEPDPVFWRFASNPFLAFIQPKLAKWTWLLRSPISWPKKTIIK
jgi:hypothetical protein